MLINIPQVLFDDVYDAREVFASKSEMPYYSVTDLKKNDLVLLETKLTKYRVQGTDKTKWNHQCVQFEMLAISLLYSADELAMGKSAQSKEIVGLHI